MQIIFVLANIVDTDEMPLYAAFHLGLHCLQKYTFRSHLYAKGLKFNMQKGEHLKFPISFTYRFIS